MSDEYTIDVASSDGIPYINLTDSLGKLPPPNSAGRSTQNWAS